jgi:uncharacterized protein DUF302
MRVNEGLEKGVLMLDNPQSLAGIVTKHSSKSVAQTVDRLTGSIADRGFTLIKVTDHSGTAERVGVQMPDSKLVMFGKPTVGAAVMLAAPLAAFPGQLRSGSRPPVEPRQTPLARSGLRSEPSDPLAASATTA